MVQHPYYLLILLLLLSPLPTLSTHANIITTQIDALPHETILDIPIDTSIQHAHYQPIDIRVSFDPPAYAENETIHSIRIGIQQAGSITELESQLYDLQYSDTTHINQASLVFLIPPEADGQETYLLRWDTQATEPTTYPQHISIQDTHYFYEPISGQKIDFDYYKITQDNNVIYGIVQTGELLGEGVSHTAIKMKPNSTEFETINTDQFGNYGMTYNIDGPLQYTGSARAQNADKSILVNGNLMIRVRIKTDSPENTVTTDGIYTYYYCPTVHKRLDAHVTHTFHETIELGGSKQRDAYLGMSTFKSRSATIENMNVGTILPAIHVYTEDDILADYELPADPDSEIQEWLLGTTDDIDLGSNGWICLDDPATGKAHGLIVDKHTGLIDDTTDGFQIKASVKQVVKLPGLEADTGSLYLTRNSYEDNTHTPTIPQGLNITFNSLFFTTETGGFEKVAEEATFYQQLIPLKPITTSNITTDPEEEADRYTLTATVHLEPTVPLGAALSAVIGKRFSYLYAELYQADSIISSGSLARLPLSEGLALNFDNTTLIQKIQLIIGLFDWRSATFFKSIQFPNIKSGTYLIKIYKENTRRQTQGQYIGFAIVDVNKDTTIRILSRPEATIQLTVNDNQENPLPNAQCQIMHQDTIISKATTDDTGKTTLTAPCYNRKSYQLQVLYQGFLIKNTPLTLKARNQFRTITQAASTPLHHLMLDVTDTWNLPIAINVNPQLTSTDMTQPQKIIPTTDTTNTYQFTNLPPATYDLLLSYKSFKIENTIDLTQDTQQSIQFPAEYHLTLDLYNAYGMPISDGSITMQRNNKQEETPITNQNITLTIPPADYNLILTKNSDILAQQPIDIRADKTLSIITTEPSTLHQLITIIGILIILFAAFLTYKNIDKKRFLPLLLAGLLITGILQPWWTLTGSENTTETYTTTLLYPPKIVTLTNTQNIQGGEIAAVPAELTTVLTLLSILVLLAIGLLLIHLILPTKRKRITLLFTILTTIFLILIIILFYIAMAQITEIGVGSIMGSGPLAISIPGETNTQTLSCSWGFSLGFYLTILTTIAYLILQFNQPFTNIITKIRYR